MKRWRTRLLLLAGGAAVAIAIPAFGQRDKAPQSLLPPGFGEPAAVPKEKAPPPERAAPAQTAPATPGATPAAPAAPAAGATSPATAPAPASGAPTTVESDEPAVDDSAAGDLEDLAQTQRPPAIEIPDAARRPTNIVGPLTPANWGLGTDEFGNANGLFLAALMRQLDAPLPSRWTSILLRRALLSRLAGAARRQSGRLGRRARRAAAAHGRGRRRPDPGPVGRRRAIIRRACSRSRRRPRSPPPIPPASARWSRPARGLSHDPVWTARRRRCAPRSRANSARASRFDRPGARPGRRPASTCSSPRRWSAPAPRPAAPSTSTGTGSTRSIPGASASPARSASTIPDRLINGAGPQIQAWLARAPMVPARSTAAGAAVAAALGVFSSHSLVELYSLDARRDRSGRGRTARSARGCAMPGSPATRPRG